MNWLKRPIVWLDNKLFSADTPEFEPMLHSIMGLGLCAGALLVGVVYACQAMELNPTLQTVIGSLYGLGIAAYAIMKVMPNIKAFDSVVKKILYILVVLAALSCAVVIGVYLLVLAIMLVVLYVVFWFCTGGNKSSDGSSSGGKTHIATLDNGVEIYKSKGLLGEAYYEGSDSYDYNANSDETEFTRK